MAISMIKHNMENAKSHLYSELGHLILIFFFFSLISYFKNCKDPGDVIFTGINLRYLLSNIT